MKEKRSNTQVIYYAVIIVILLAGISVRGYMWINHFADCDDLGVAISILRGQSKAEWSLGNCKEGFLSFRNFGWTYAPLQVAATSLLLCPALSYKATIALGRLPSFFSGCFALILTWIILEYLFKENKQRGQVKLTVLAGILLMATSYENIIYSAQMEPYAVGVLGSIIFFGLLKWNKDDFKPILTALIVAPICCSQYQMFVLAFAFFAVYLFKNLRKRKELIKVSISAIISVILTERVWLDFLRNNRGSRGVNWNIGVDGQYLFLPNGRSGIEMIRYTLTFLIVNLKECFQYLLLPCKIVEISNILAIIILLIAVFGLVKMHRKENLAWRDVALFIDIILAAQIFLVLLGKLTLGPSRHLLVLVPVFLVCICYGLYVLLGMFRKKIIGYILCGMTDILILTLFLFELPEQIQLRSNKVSEEYMQDLLSEHNVDFMLTYGYSMDVYAMNLEGYETETDPSLWNGIVYRDNYDFNTMLGTDILIYSTRGGLGEGQLERALGYLSKVLEENTGEVYQLHATRKYESEAFWNGSQEYAAEKFGGGYYGEYVYIYHIE